MCNGTICLPIVRTSPSFCIYFGGQTGWSPAGWQRGAGGDSNLSDWFSTAAKNAQAQAYQALTHHIIIEEKWEVGEWPGLADD